MYCLYLNVSVGTSHWAGLIVTYVRMHVSRVGCRSQGQVERMSSVFIYVF